MTRIPLNMTGLAPWHTLRGGLSLAITVSGFLLGGGPTGLVLGGLLAGCWYVLPPVYVFTIGQFALAAIVTTANAPLVVGLSEAGLIGLLIHRSYYEQSRWDVLRTGSGLGLCLLGAWYGTRSLSPLWQPIALLVGSFALLTYVGHRYEQLTLGGAPEKLETTNE